MNDSLSPTASPCVRICIIDGKADICVGCGRKLPEIARWSRMSESERLNVMAELPSRLARLATANEAKS